MENLRLQAAESKIFLIKAEEADGDGERDDDGGSATFIAGNDDCGDLERALRRLETFFYAFGFYESCKLDRSIVSWSVFLILGVVVPAAVFALFYYVFDVEASRIVVLDIGIPVTQITLAFFSLICVSHNLTKYGMRRFVFVEKRYEEMERLHRMYVMKIKGFFPILFLWMLPCIVVKTVHVTILVFFVYYKSWELSVALLLASVLSWTYLTMVFLASCSLFYVTCSLQVIHFDEYEKLLVDGADVSVLFDEHKQICFYISKISHRFRLLLILLFFISIVTQTIFLLQTTRFHGTVDFVNGGDFFISSAAQVIGIVMCLNAATRISRRAQNVASAASSWHVSETCKDFQNCQKNLSGNVGFVSENPLTQNHLGNMPSQPMIQSRYLQREALVMYLGCNNSGITVYGWCIDRGLITTIVCIELSILCFIFSGTL